MKLKNHHVKEAKFDPDFGGGGGGSSTAHETMQTVSRHQLIYSIIGLVVGLLMALGGVGLFLNGIAGDVSWTVNVLGLESQLSDTGPGAILFVVGLVVVFTTRYVFKVSK
jgi:hypothetical protein